MFQQDPPEAPKKVIHHHFSAKMLRTLAGVEETGGMYWCPTCAGDTGTPGRHHAANQDARIKLIISSSTLHEFWKEGNYAGDPVHVDWITSPGGTIQSLQ